MAGELYFIKTNPVIAKINLYNKLDSEENLFIVPENDAKINLEIIRKKLKDSVENLTQEEFSFIFQWFFNQYKGNFEEVKNQLYHNGIDLFYDITSASVISNFHHILSHFETHSDRRLNYILDPVNFNLFLIYGLFYTGLINQYNNQEDKNSFLIDFLKSDHQYLFSFAEHQLNVNLKTSGKETDILFKENIHHHFVELYDLTKFYKGTLIKLHQL